jgi:hypothetical protein
MIIFFSCNLFFAGIVLYLQSGHKKGFLLKKLAINPVIYEINTCIWLEELSRELNTHITLSNIPDKKWDEIARLNFHAVWLMGVWKRSPEGVRISGRDIRNISAFKQALPDFQESDNTGSPYCVKDYSVDPMFGGNAGLSTARHKLAERNISLILDFVPNHLAFDHPWVTDHPDFFIHGSEDDIVADPVTFKRTGSHILACGKDPYYPAWEDVLQLNAFSIGLRQFAVKTLTGIASMCDGVRCDMAMLLLNDVFQKTWGIKAGERPEEEYWSFIIESIKKENPGFTFIAEAYWDMEYILQQNGFDFCYDKRLYDRLKGNDVNLIRQHLSADIKYQAHLVRFIENHDEPRVLSVFNLEKKKAAAIIIMSVPGAKLIHEGQLEGRRIHLPVFLRRRPYEEPNILLKNFYANLLDITGSVELHGGDWFLCPVSGWDDNQSCRNILAWYWKYENKICLAAINFCAYPSQGFVYLRQSELAGHSWRLVDLFTQEHYIRAGDEMEGKGLYVGLEPWGFHFFQMFRII